MDSFTCTVFKSTYSNCSTKKTNFNFLADETEKKSATFSHLAKKKRVDNNFTLEQYLSRRKDTDKHIKVVSTVAERN